MKWRCVLECDGDVVVAGQIHFVLWPLEWLCSPFVPALAPSHVLATLSNDLIDSERNTRYHLKSSKEYIKINSTILSTFVNAFLNFLYRIKHDSYCLFRVLPYMYIQYVCIDLLYWNNLYFLTCIHITLVTHPRVAQWLFVRYRLTGESCPLLF